MDKIRSYGLSIQALVIRRNSKLLEPRCNNSNNSPTHENIVLIGFRNTQREKVINNIRVYNGIQWCIFFVASSTQSQLFGPFLSDRVSGVE